MLCKMVGPMALNRVVSALSEDDAGLEATAAKWVVLVFFAQVMQALADCYTGLQSEVMAIQGVSLFKSLLYRKMMRLSARSRKEKSTGELTNMFTADCDALVCTSVVLHQTWLIPVQILVVSYLLVGVLGVAAFAGIAVIVFMLRLNHYVSGRMHTLQHQTRHAKDKRMKKVAEAFKAVSIVKLNAWEGPVTTRIDAAREIELGFMLQWRIMTSVSIVLLWGMPVFISIAAFGTYAGILHRELSPAIVFTSLALFQLIQAPLRTITTIASMLSQSKVALDRISSFLDMPELDQNSVVSNEDPSGYNYAAKNVIVAVKDGEFAWGDEDNLPILKNVNLEVKVGDFLVVHGIVGCGKSSLCSVLLGEMEKRKGMVYVGGTVAYCSQQAWIQNMTVRDNILFGRPMDQNKYEKVLDACALTADLKLLPARDNTEIGERGVNLSGGQKTRIALARACYSNASIYILDSPLSAVDAIVQNEIFHKCFLGLLRNKTIILITHNPEIIASSQITSAVTIDDAGTLVESYRADSQPETVIVTYCGLRAAKSLFERMTNSLLHAPMRFFDVNPIGRVLTRYGGDVVAVDVQIPFTFGTLVANIFSVGCTLITAAFVIRWKGFLLLPVVAVYGAISRFYISPARELQRLLKTTQAPILNHISESVDGAPVVRAFGSHQIQRFFQTTDAKLDENHKVWYAQLYVSQWFSLRIQFVGSLLVLVVTSSLVWLHRQINVAIIGLIFAYALKIAANLEGIVRVLTRVETIMISPERMQEYIDIEQEAPYRIAMTDPPAQLEWPYSGSIVFDKVSFRYKQGGKLVLNNLSFVVEGGQKIGIVGRTGAGKSSITMALFRINELTSGSISIDGVDVGKIGLKTLRENLSIIPQMPVLFKGSLREYLDPFGDLEDQQLWESIRQVGLDTRISDEELKLLMIIEENGENFSVGERQMLCMARALLRHSRIVIFDEATAAIDYETDQKLQRVIRTAFANYTVVTIAHRLDTILDSDRILVLDGGRLVEFATPTELVSNGRGHFFELMREGGYLDKFASQTRMKA
ncbi:hypothetical protein BBI17_008725 [Phytophthora kernoviae]|uniref:Uncharacterized protein n=1 Tax=Phytophthora kernoviae TaxID=325452 RepID=A0A3R7GIW2_9STRA|nr:hypothetical protein BBI17_008725 [Phytophthora kernoviae]